MSGPTFPIHPELPPTDADLAAHAVLGEVWCRACDQPATGPDRLCDPHRAAAVAQLGHCPYPRGTFDDRDRCLCGLAVGFDGDWFHTLEEATL